MRRWWAALSILVIEWAPAVGAPYVVLYDYDLPILGTGLTIEGSPALNDLGQIAYTRRYGTSNPPIDHTDVYTVTSYEAGVESLVFTDTVVGNYINVGGTLLPQYSNSGSVASINNNGDIAFHFYRDVAGTANDRDVVYSWNDGVLTQRVQDNADLGFQAINDANQIVYRDSAVSRVYRIDGNTSTDLGAFSGRIIGINDSGQIAWSSTSPSGSLTIRDSDGTLNVIPVADLGSNLGSSFNDAGQALLAGTLGQVLLVDPSGTVDVVMDFPDNWAVVTSLNDLGGFAVLAIDVFTQSYYLYATPAAGGTPVEILSTNDLLDDHLIERIGISSASFNNLGELAISYRSTNSLTSAEERGIAHLKVVPETGSIALLLVSSLAVIGVLRTRVSTAR